MQTTDPTGTVPRAAVIDGFEFDWARRRIPKQVYEQTDITHWLALDVALQALTDAGYEATVAGSPAALPPPAGGGSRDAARPLLDEFGLPDLITSRSSMSTASTTCSTWRLTQRRG